MKRPNTLALAVFLPLVATAALVPAAAWAGTRVGNGGGAWVCKDKRSLKVRWIRLADLFEAEEEYRLTLAAEPASTDAWAILEDKLAAIRDGLPALAGMIGLDGPGLRGLIEVGTDRSTLSPTDDGVIRVRPRPETCLNGYLYYGQLANFTNDGRVLIAKEFTEDSAFSPNQLAALYLHEIVYKALRDRDGDATSTRAREIVALMFSDLPLSELRKRTEKVLAEAPEPAAPSSVTLVAREVHCHAQVVATGADDVAPLERPLTPGSSNRERSAVMDRFEFKISTDLQDGLPDSVEILDSVSGARVAFGPEVVRPLILANRQVRLSLESRSRERLGTLRCDVAPYPSVPEAPGEESVQ